MKTMEVEAFYKNFEYSAVNAISQAYKETLTRLIEASNVGNMAAPQEKVTFATEQLIDTFEYHWQQVGATFHKQRHGIIDANVNV